MSDILVKCQKCGKKVDREVAFKVTSGTTNKYYCNEAEYQSIIAEREDRQNMWELIEEIFGEKIINTALNKEISIIHSVYPYSIIKSYLANNKDMITKIMDKDFNTDYHKIRYFSAILKNSLHDYKEVETKPTIKKIVTQNSMKFSRNKKRRALSDIEGDI